MAELEPDLTHIHWSSPEWIYNLPTRSLSTSDEALDYFALSPFWDVKSNNHALRTQRRVFDPFYGAAQERLDLPSFRGGFEYIVSHSRSPDLYLIQRRDVEADGSRSKVKGMFFILQAKIYSSPTLYDVMNTRVKNARFLLAETFQQLASSRPPSNPRVSSFWQALPPVASTSKSATVNASRPSGSSTPAVQSEIEAPVTQASVESRSRNDIDMDQLLYNALQSSHSRLVALEQQARVSRKASAAAPVKRMQDVMGMKGDISFLTATQGTSTVAGTPAAGGGLTQIGVRRMPSVTTMTLEALSSPMSLS